MAHHLPTHRLPSLKPPFQEMMNTPTTARQPQPSDLRAVGLWECGYATPLLAPVTWAAMDKVAG